ncbi:MAG: hypothetical protein LBU12_05730, partial [Deltaproteobacteria bacterium]|nr:hypothetical protein [Deltaproteobacteria bacterium]
MEANRICDRFDTMTSDGQLNFYLNIKERTEKVLDLFQSLLDEGFEFNGPDLPFVLTILSREDLAGGLIVDRDGRLIYDGLGGSLDPEAFQLILDSAASVKQAFYRLPLSPADAEEGQASDDSADAEEGQASAEPADAEEGQASAEPADAEEGQASAEP